MMKNLRSAFLYCAMSILIPGLASAQKGTANKQQIQQVEIVTFKPGTSEADQHMVDNSFRRTANKLPVVHTFTSVIANDSKNNIQVKHVYITTFNSNGDLNTYNASPEHQAVTKTTAPYVDNITTINYPVNK